MHTIRDACLGAVLAMGWSVVHAETAEDQLAQVVTELMQPTGSKGSYFTRRGLANLGGLPFGVVATGARTMVVNFYLRNVGQTTVGEPKVLAALQREGYALLLAETLPTLTPEQQRLYTDRCTGAAAGDAAPASASAA